MTSWRPPPTDWPVNRFSGSPRQAVILGTIGVVASYGIIFSMMLYVVAFASGYSVIFIRGNCAARAGTAVESLLYGRGVSPLCSDGLEGQFLALLLPLLEMCLAFIIIRGPPPPEGDAMEPAVEAAIRTVFAPLAPKISMLRLRQWAGTSRITPDGVLFSPGVAGEFRAWVFGAPIDPRRLPAHHAIFTTLHELGHLSLHDVLYSRGADRAVPTASIFVALFLLVAMPAGKIAEGYWLSVVLTGMECVAGVFATRCVLGRLLTNLEFLMDNFAAAQAIGLTGRRLSLPPAVIEGSRFWLRRSHPALAARREYLRTMRCSDFLWAYLLALPMMVLLQWASTPSGDTMPAITMLIIITDIVNAASLCILGVFGGAAVGRGGFPVVCRCYGLSAGFLAALILTDGLFNTLPYFADLAHRLSMHGRSGVWLLVLAAPLAGIALRRRTTWFDVDPGEAAAGLPAIKSTTQGRSQGVGRKPAEPLRRLAARMRFSTLAKQFYHGGVTFAAAEAAVFGFIVLEYALDTGVYSWVEIVLFGTYFAIPLCHAIRPAWRGPLVLDLLFQTFFLSGTVVFMVALQFAGVLDALAVPAFDTMENAPPAIVPGLVLAFRSILDGSLFRLHGHEIFQDVRWLWLLMATVGILRLAGQRIEKRQQKGLQQ
jgi:hypothetical protein